MKLRSFLSPVTIAAIAAGFAIAMEQPARSSEKYFCAEYQGSHRTFARSSRGPLMMISWNRETASNWTPQRRCVEGSRRFQRFHDHGLLKHLGTGIVNRQPVLCAVSNKGDACNSDNVLVTLPPATNAIDAARQLLDTRGLARGRVIEVNGKKGKVETYINGEAYYDLGAIEQLREITVEDTLTPVNSY